jgi:hypothetical protein
MAKKLSVLVTVIVFVGIMFFGSSPRVLAANPDRLDFPPFGITPDMFVRLYLVNIGTKQDKACTVKLVIFSNNQVVGSFQPNTIPGQIEFNEVDGSNVLLGSTEERAQLRAVVIRNVNKRNKCNVLASVEGISKDTGETLFVIDNPTLTRDPSLVNDILSIP